MDDSARTDEERGGRSAANFIQPPGSLRRRTFFVLGNEEEFVNVEGKAPV